MRLSIVYRPHGAYPLPGQANPTHRWTLSCHPAGGSHPQRGIACAEVAKHGAELYQRALRCLLIARGAPSASVTGVIGGHRVRFAASPCSPAWRTLHVLLTGSA